MAVPIERAVRHLHFEITDVQVKINYQTLRAEYQKHANEVEKLWRSFTPSQRADTVKAYRQVFILKHKDDKRHGVFSLTAPEWNLHDLAEGSPDFLLQMLKFRATNSLLHQYKHGVDNGPGDLDFITDAMKYRGLKHARTDIRLYYYYLFEEDEYGRFFFLKDDSDREALLETLQPQFEDGSCVSMSKGSFILQRQVILIDALGKIIGNIVKMGSGDVGTLGMSKLSIETASFGDLLKSAKYQRESHGLNTILFCQKPVILAQAVNTWFSSRPELVPDEMGRVLPVNTGKYASIAVFEAVNTEVRAAHVWNYIRSLVELLVSTTDKSPQSFLLQEITNICHVEYDRARAFFQRQVSTGTGSKWFKRISNQSDNGGPRLKIKSKFDHLLQDDAQLYYMLHLCQPDVNAFKAIDWIKKLNELYRTHPQERDRLQEREIESLSGLSAKLDFLQALSSSFSLPTVSRKLGQVFITNENQLNAELTPMKFQIDLSGFAVPIDRLLEPKKSKGVILALENFIVDKGGMKHEDMYLCLVDDCVSAIKAELRAKADQRVTAESEADQRVNTEHEADQQGTAESEDEDKTQPTPSSFHVVTGTLPNGMEILKPLFKVKASTAEVFQTLLSGKLDQGSVTWLAFETAMADLKFSVVPKFGSVFTFIPPKTMSVQKPIELHRPPKSLIQGYQLAMVAAILGKVYGWNENTFVVA